MSRYETLNTELISLRCRQTTSCLIPGICVGVFTGVLMSEQQTGMVMLIAGVVATVISTVMFHFMWQYIFPAYNRWCERASQLLIELAQIRAKMTAVFAKYPNRQKGQQFKTAYELAGKALSQLEESLTVGMHRENREVFVTVFLVNKIAVRVTAAIGSPYRCSAADNPVHWPTHVVRLKCDSIRQYHNHPEYNGCTRPSPTDFRSARTLSETLGSHAAKLRSFVICWNAIGECKIIEYDTDGCSWLHAEYDASAEKIIAVDMQPE